MTKTPAFNCPSCDAPQKAEDAAGKNAITCPYCNATVPVPAHLRRLSAEQITRHAGKLLRTMLIVGAAVTVTIVVVVFVVCSQIGRVAEKGIELASRRTQGPSATEPAGAGPSAGSAGSRTRTAATVDHDPDRPSTGRAEARGGGRDRQQETTSDPGEGAVVLRFKARGEDKFALPRSIAVDGDGNIYVGERGGRVQKFDATGKFLLQIDASPCPGHTDLIAGRAGQLYMTCMGSIRQYKAGDGSLVKQIRRGARVYYTHLYVDSRDTLYAFNYSHGHDAIVKIKPFGRVLSRWRRAISGVEAGLHPPSARLAVAADGTVYALEQKRNAVFVFSPQGKFRNQWRPEERCKAPRSPSGFDVDSGGRLYIAGSREIAVCTGSGTPVKRIPLPVSGVQAMRLDDRGDVYVVSYKREVLKVRPGL